MKCVHKRKIISIYSYKLEEYINYLELILMYF